jgi:hypothetical protein
MDLIDRGLYDRGPSQVRCVPEEQAMRYTAVCTSMLSDRVENLDQKMEESGKRTEVLEGALGPLMGRQERLNDKVELLVFDFGLNLKHHFQVVDFEAKMLSFSLNESVLVHQDWTQQSTMVQEQFGLQQDRISGVEETFQLLTAKVGICSTGVKRPQLTEHLRFPIWRGTWGTQTCVLGLQRRRPRKHGF